MHHYDFLAVKEGYIIGWAISPQKPVFPFFTVREADLFFRKFLYLKMNFLFFYFSPFLNLFNQINPFNWTDLN